MTALVTRRTARPGAVPAIAGIGFLAAWIAGLTVAAANTDVRTSGASIVTQYGAALGSTTAQYVLTEGVTTVALAVVLLAVVRAARAAGSHAMARVITIAGAGAVLTAFAECALGLVLTGWAVPAGNAGAAGALFDTVNRLDGIKMLLLAGVGIGALLAGRTRVLPRLLNPVAVLLAIAMAASGIGYLLLLPSLAMAAYVSLPLLLLWVVAASVTAGRNR